MKKRLVQSLSIIVFLLVIFIVAKSNDNETITYESDTPFSGVMDVVPDISAIPTTELQVVDVVAEPEVPEIETSELYLQYQQMGYSSEEFYEDLALLEAITIAEAGNQSELGKRLVIDCVLNRIDSARWRDDDTIKEVITHPYQFETYTNGAYTRVELDESVGQLVEEEILNRTNYDVIYFRTGCYFSCVPAIMKEGDHYFSGESKQY
mgnify:FL=1